MYTFAKNALIVQKSLLKLYTILERLAKTIFTNKLSWLKYCYLFCVLASQSKHYYKASERSK